MPAETTAVEFSDEQRDRLVDAAEKLDNVDLVEMLLNVFAHAHVLAEHDIDEFLAGELFGHRARSRFQGDDERVFCHLEKGSPLDGKRYAETFRAALVKAGITDYVRPFHDRRHTAITNDAAAGHSGLDVMKRAGHSDFRVTQQYLDLAGVDFAEEAERAAARAFVHVPRAKVRQKT